MDYIRLQKEKQRLLNMKTRKDAKVFLLIKMGEEKYMRDLLCKGEIYMNSVEYYRTHENPEIGDCFEGVKEIKDGRITKRRENIDKEKLYCMWHINNATSCHNAKIEFLPDGNTVIQTLDFREYKDFGDKMVVVTNVKEFNKRLNNALCKLNLTQNNEIVTYYDEKTSRKNISAFMKPLKYNHQNEIRYIVNTLDTEPLKIEIGNIKDIACIYPVAVEIKIHRNKKEE